MLLYSKLKNEEAKEYEVINQKQAEKLGWEKHDLECGFDGKFYLTGCCPEKPESLKKAERISELKKKLADTDYIWNVINEGDATQVDYEDVIKNRKEWRSEIRVLEDE